MTKYLHLRKINFANNNLEEVTTLLSIKYLTHLNLSNNKIE